MRYFKRERVDVSAFRCPLISSVFVRLFEAGAALVHIHVRNEDQSPGSDPEKFAAIQKGVKKYCPGMIIQFSTGGRGRDQSQRGSMLHLKPDMASLATGSVNFPKSIYENPPEFVDGLAKTMLEHSVKPEIEVFALAMLYNAVSLIKRDLLKNPPHVQVVMGIPNAMPARRSILEFLIQEYKELIPGGTWTAAGTYEGEIEHTTNAGAIQTVQDLVKFKVRDDFD